MPNWCEGVLKLRGKKENIDTFFSEAIQPCGGIHENDLNFFINIDMQDEYTSICIKSEAWIKDTRRAFVLPYDIFYENREALIVCFPFEQAWDVATEDLIGISKTYDLDVRAYAFESGMGFCREVEVINGEVTIDSTITYSNWWWECPCPLTGG